MADDRISLRQLLSLLFAALLAPAIGVLPAQTAALAGEAGWLSALAALPVLLAALWVLWALLRPAGEGAGLAQVTQRVLGRPLGRLVLLLCLGWGLLLLAANARLFSLRFLSTSYSNSPAGLFLAVLLVPGLGDVAGIVLLIENRLLLPLVLYLASAAAHGFGLLLARRVERWE